MAEGVELLVASSIQVTPSVEANTRILSRMADCLLLASWVSMA